ncbi:hypothetical protein NL50_00685 [Clostridium acetobutylicum]|nr:hypothetical protein NL50_00685 [Clostridium acetobutylicum]
MDDKNLFRNYNDIVVSEEEIEKYETKKVDDDVLSKMKNKVKKLYMKVNMEEAFEKVEKQFEDDEKVEYMFWAETYGVRKYQMVCGGYYSLEGAVSNDWGTKTGIVLTNKGIFGIETNDAYGVLKIKNFRFKDVEYIESKKIKNNFTVFAIKSTSGIEIKVEIYNGDRHIKFLNYIRNNNIKVNIRMVQDRRIQIAYVSIIIIIMIFIIFVISSSIMRSGITK